jgi:hypothetical protein
LGQSCEGMLRSRNPAQADYIGVWEFVRCGALVEHGLLSGTDGSDGSFKMVV